MHPLPGAHPRFGASFSAPYARDLGIDPDRALAALCDELGLRHFRLMSFWNQIEAQRGQYDWRELDRQIECITARGGRVSLCLGIRQPHYPEFHQPDWAKQLGPSPERNEALNTFIIATIKRYRDQPAVQSWQLENEALNRSFGEGDDFDRNRLCTEYGLVRELDVTRPIIMTTSNAWGIPVRQPVPDIVGFSMYSIQHKNGRYQQSLFKPWAYRWRSNLVRTIWRRPSFIHELQLEPWGPRGTQQLTMSEQDESMGPERIRQNIAWARSTGLARIDLWGGEWWYWRRSHGDETIWQTVASELANG